MYKSDLFTFNIEDFNKIIEGGEGEGLKYIYDNIIKWYKIDNYKYTRNDYIISLFNSVQSIYDCVIATEQANNITSINIYDYYATLKDLLLKELNIIYDINKNKYIIEDV